MQLRRGEAGEEVVVLLSKFIQRFLVYKIARRSGPSLFHTPSSHGVWRIRRRNPAPVLELTTIRA
jgi:hypothetical protein